MSYSNPGTSPIFNRELIRLVKSLPSDQSILELGSGHTTKLINDNRGRKSFQSLEHSQKWYDDIVDRPGMKDVVTLAPLVSDGLSSNVFYDTRLITISNVGLLIVDGPPGGKRWPGVLLCWKFLAPSYIVLFDDMSRKQYRAGLELWMYANCRSREERTDNPSYFDDGRSAIFRGKK